jgi:site-specific DNA-methyltransferase (cytosine-N4-specific)
MHTRLMWNSYQYFPYERELASREVNALLKSSSVRHGDDGLILTDQVDFDRAQRLTYFAAFANGNGHRETTQFRLEKLSGLHTNRQVTRYSVHGLHDYKGKFNPQVARAILNIFDLRPNDRVFDPFCGSGTTLVECAHLGLTGCGTDLNPLAVFIANAKLQALATSASELQASLRLLTSRISRTKRWDIRLPDDARSLYLRSWFTPSVLKIMEIINLKIKETTGSLAPIFLAIMSNRLRDYSLQDPNDLRIRRRKSPLPVTPLSTAFLAACTQVFDRLHSAQELLGTRLPVGKARLCDVSSLASGDMPDLFDAAITSPPYAMALPYIDTQRLSLVWLNLISPDDILKLDAELIGSREIRGVTRRALLEKLLTNAARLPEAQAAFCRYLQKSLGPGDGFRRQVVPSLLYRYFAGMKNSFEKIRSVMKLNTRFAVIVGHNHTVLGGIRHAIDTPRHLASIAEAAGWRIDETIPLQTYQRYGYHMSNAVAAEALVVLRNTVRQ